MSLRKEICFKNGKLKVLQISDLQDTKATSVDTLRFIDGAMKKIKPDLIIFTGDQLDVVGLWGKGEKNMENVTDAIKNLFGIFEKYDVPYVLTFGNHDRETGISNDEQAKIYSEFANCICFDNVDDGRPDSATFNVPVLSSDKKKTALNFYVIDSHSSNGSSYDAVNENQIEWLKKTSETLKENNDGKLVPSMAFQHIPVPEIYRLLIEVKKGTKGALPAYNSRRGKFFALDESMVGNKGDFGETPSTPTEKGEFDALKNQGDVFAMFFGHDHYNSFLGKVDGIDLGYCPGAGYNTYGLKNRGMRVFEFDEKSVRDYKTYTIYYNDVCSQAITQPLKNYIYSIAPSTPHAAAPFAIKCVGILAIIVVALILLYNFLSKVAVITAIVIIALTAVVYITLSLVRSAVLRKRILKEWRKN